MNNTIEGRYQKNSHFMKTTWIILSALLFSFSLFGQDFALEQLEKSPRHHEWVGGEYEGSQENKQARENSYERMLQILEAR